MEHIMHDHITALLDAGYSVTVEPDLKAAKGLGPRRYFAHVDMDGHPELGCTSDGATPAEAIWNASPLHDDDEPMPAIADLIAETSEGLRDALGIVREEADPNRRITAMREDVTYLIEDNAKLADRISALEADRRDMTVMIRALGDLITRAFPDGLLATHGDGPKPAEGNTQTVRVAEGIIDSHSWACSKCGAQCIGPEPEGSVGRCCGGE